MILCQKKSCQDYASWYPVFLLYAPPEHGAHEPIRVTVEMGLCNFHRSIAALENLLGDEQWEYLMKMIGSQGYVLPDRSLTRLDWRAIS